MYFLFKYWPAVLKVTVRARRGSSFCVHVNTYSMCLNCLSVEIEASVKQNQSSDPLSLCPCPSLCCQSSRIKLIDRSRMKGSKKSFMSPT